MTRHSILRAALLLILVASATTGTFAQAARIPELRSQLQERYELVALQQGIALVPRRGAGIRLIQVVDGVITIDGEAVTGAQLRDRLGADAGLVLQASYLDAASQRALAGAAAATDTAPPPSAPAPREPPARTRVRNGDISRVGGSVTVARDERVQGDVAVAFGSADIDGEVTGDVNVAMGSLNLGPDAIVRGDVNVAGGNVNRAAGAQILGELHEVGINGGGRRGGRAWRFGDRFGTFWSSIGSLAATVLRTILMVLAGLIAFAAGRETIEKIAARTAGSPVRAGLVGLAAQLLFTPLLVVTVVVLAISIVGIPLLLLVPFAVVMIAIVALVGFTGLAYEVGRRLTGRFGWTDRGSYGAVALGMVVIVAVTLLAKIAAVAGGRFLSMPLVVLGYATEYVAWTVGFGAAILVATDWQRQRRSRANAVPPPIPPHA